MLFRSPVSISLLCSRPYHLPGFAEISKALCRANRRLYLDTPFFSFRWVCSDLNCCPSVLQITVFFPPRVLLCNFRNCSLCTDICDNSPSARFVYTTNRAWKGADIDRDHVTALKRTLRWSVAFLINLSVLCSVGGLCPSISFIFLFSYCYQILYFDCLVFCFCVFGPCLCFYASFVTATSAVKIAG